MTVDRLVVGRAAAFGLLIGVPAAMANVVLASQDPKPKAALNGTLLALLVAFAVSGFVAGREASDTPVLHGALAGLVTFALVQVIGVLGRLDRGDGVAVGQGMVLALVAAGAAAATSRLGSARAEAVRARAELAEGDRTGA